MLTVVVTLLPTVGGGRDWHLFVIGREGLERAGSKRLCLTRSRINFNLLCQTQLWQIPVRPSHLRHLENISINWQINVNLILKKRREKTFQTRGKLLDNVTKSAAKTKQQNSAGFSIKKPSKTIHQYTQHTEMTPLLWQLVYLWPKTDPQQW